MSLKIYTIPWITRIRKGQKWGEVNWLFNATINDISVIYVTAHRCAGRLKKKLDLRSGSQRHRHFVGFFNVPVQTPTRGHPFYTVIPRNRPIKSPFTTRWGYGGHILDSTPGPHGRGGKSWPRHLTVDHDIWLHDPTWIWFLSLLLSSTTYLWSWKVSGQKL